MIDIYTAIDNGKEVTLLPLLRSIKENTTRPFRFNVLTGDNINAVFLKNSLSKIHPECNICAVSMPGIKVEQTNWITKAMYFRWLIPHSCLAQKAIYIDNDVIFTGDVGEMYDTKLDFNLIAAVPDIYHKTLYTAWHVHCPADMEPQEWMYDIPMYLSGQLVINCRQWRRTNTTAALIALANKYGAMDMMPLSIACRGKVKPLSNRWYFPGYCYLDKKGLLKGNRADDALYKRWPEGVGLIHWNGRCKPWNFRDSDINKGIYNLEQYERYL